MDVYTEENRQYYKNGCFCNNQHNTFTDDEVIEFRKRYVNESAVEIYNSLPENKCTVESFKQILFGRFYSHLPIYDKRQKKWTNL